MLQIQESHGDCKETSSTSEERKQPDLSYVEETTRKVSLQTPHTPQSLNNWNADTGATEHLTPHYHWLTDYKPLEVPIKLADNSIVYSAGIGSVVFNPFIQEKQSHLTVPCVW